MGLHRTAYADDGADPRFPGADGVPEATPPRTTDPIGIDAGDDDDDDDDDDGGQPSGPGSEAPLRPRRTRTGTQIYEAPPIRYTERGTMIGEPLFYEQTFDEADLIRRISTARTVLDSARSRDDAIEALVAAVMVIARRVALFRVRSDELVGIGTPRSEIEGVGGKVVPLHKGSPMAEVVDVGRWSGTTNHPDLALAVGNPRPFPAVLRRIDVRGRAVLVVYADHGGREFLPAETAQLDELCAAASDTFEAILKLRRAAKHASGTPTPVPTATSLEAGPHDDWAPPSDRIRAAYGFAAESDEDEGEAGAPRATLEVELSVPPVRVPSTSDDADDEPVPRDTAELSPRLDRVAVADDPPSKPPPSTTPEELSNMKLTWVGAPPPPPLPPPPEADTDEHEGRQRVPTLHGLPPLDESDIDGAGEEIISLSTPLAQTSVRGRIALEEEDYVDPSEASGPTLTSHVDEIVDGIARGENRLQELEDIGELGWRRLAARFPGPIEVLRRDLRALPPPAAHGPLIRATINAGATLAPHLLDLLSHPNPDVRFYAAFVFQEVRDSRCTDGLADLAFDANPDVRVIAMRVLETYSRTQAFATATARVRERLTHGSRAEYLYAARAVGTLRDVEAIPRLIELLSNKDRFIQEAALESLCSITGQQHGLKPHRWKSWYADNGQRHRVEWIIDSLRHRDLPVRRWAADELIRVTGHRIPFSPMGDRRSRDVAAQAWTDWWEGSGRRLLTAERQEPTAAART